MSRSIFALVVLSVVSTQALGSEPSGAVANSRREQSAKTADAADEWRATARAGIRALVNSTDRSREAAARKLLDLYREIPTVAALADNERSYWRDLMANRLRRAARQLAARAGRIPTEVAAGPLAQLEANLRDVIAPGRWAQGREILAQQVGPGAARPLFGAGGVGGGPAAAAANADYGDDLVEVIQATIAPATWDVNGGPGVIRYFRPLRVLVVRQTDEVHEQLGGVLGGLRQ